MNDDLISRSALLERFENAQSKVGSLVETVFFDGVMTMVDTAPAVDAEPVRHGKWVDNGLPNSMLSKCSECGMLHGACTFNYCPHCGAKMDGDT